RVEEDEVDGPFLELFGQGLQHLEGRSPAHLDPIGETGRGELGLGEVGMLGFELDGDQLPVGGETPGDPDARVATEGPELQGESAGSGGGQDLEETPHVRADRYRRKA